ncbi:MAG: DUF2185 domain-containing protein [Ruminococcus sp.]|jgi:hypothetical protein|nr:DUF2185 domain-containing protein [Ruminococcus sp.]
MEFTYYKKKIEELRGKIEIVTQASDLSKKRVPSYKEFASMLTLPSVIFGNQNKTPDDFKKMLKEFDNITNYEEAVNRLEYIKRFGTAYMYYQFLKKKGAVEGEPLDPETLSPEQVAHYNTVMEFCEDYMYPIIGNNQLYAYDVVEGLRIINQTYEAGYFSEQVAAEFSDDFVKQALHSYISWEDYAVHFICGGALAYFSNQEQNEENARLQFDTLYRISELLFFGDNTEFWLVSSWPLVKSYFENLRIYPNIYPKDNLCIVSNEVSQQNKKIGWMFREKTEIPNDSGWRIFSGDEDNEYIDNPDNLHTFELNILCNYDTDIVEILGSPVGTAYHRDENGRFELDSNVNE